MRLTNVQALSAGSIIPDGTICDVWATSDGMLNIDVQDGDGSQGLFLELSPVAAERLALALVEYAEERISSALAAAEDLGRALPVTA